MSRRIDMTKFGASVRLVGSLIPVYGKMLVTGQAAEIMRVAPPRTPVHTGGRTKLGRVAYSGGGRLRASWTVARSPSANANRPASAGIPGTLAADRAAVGLRGLRPVLYVLNRAARGGRPPYALYPLWGRTIDRRGRPIGSLQLPQGIQPVIEEALTAARPRIVEAAKRETKRRFTGGLLG